LIGGVELVADKATKRGFSPHSGRRSTVASQHARCNSVSVQTRHRPRGGHLNLLQLIIRKQRKLDSQKCRRKETVARRSRRSTRLMQASNEIQDVMANALRSGRQQYGTTQISKLPRTAPPCSPRRSARLIKPITPPRATWLGNQIPKKQEITQKE
jgi:hypothetical protein